MITLPPLETQITKPKNCHSDLFFTKNKINVMALIHNEVANFQYTVATALHDTQPKISKVTSWWLQCIMVSNNISKTNFKMYINFSPRNFKKLLQCPCLFFTRLQQLDQWISHNIFKVSSNIFFGDDCSKWFIMLLIQQVLRYYCGSLFFEFYTHKKLTPVYCRNGGSLNQRQTV